MLVVTVHFEIHSDHVDEFRKAMCLQASNSLEREPACRQFDVCFDPERDERCFLYEKYDDQPAFDEHLASDHFQSFNATVSPWVVQKDIQTWVLQD